MIKKYGSRTNITTDINKEPVLKDLFPPKASSGGNVPIRGDIILLDIGGVKKRGNTAGLPSISFLTPFLSYCGYDGSYD